MKIEMRWRCSCCHSTHEDEEDAAQCCPPLNYYICPTCDNDWVNEADALACCYTGEDEKPKDPTPEELEKAGQQRLIP